MKKICLLFVPVVAIFFNGCSEDDETGGCKVGSQTYAIDKTWAYSSTAFSINVTGTCVPTNSKVFIDDVIVDHTTGTSAIKFSIPPADKDSVVITLKNGSTILFSQKIALFPRSGTWTEVSTFPGEVRSNCVAVPYNGKIYLAGGRRFITSTTFTSYGDYYSLNTGTNQWSLEGNSDFLKGVTLNGAVDGDALYFLNGDSYKIISVTAENNVEEVGNALSNSQWTSFQGNAYQIRNPSQGNFVIEKFSAANGAWDEVKKQIHGYGTTPDYIIIASTFTYGKKIYFTTYTSGQGDFWSFEPETSNLELISAMELKYFLNGGPKFLFAVNGLAYFMDRGGIGFDVNGNLSSGGLPRNFIHIYNIKANEWIESEMQFPEQFRSFISYSANDKLFAGLNTNVTVGSPVSTGLSYSNKIYEFIPE